MFRCPSFRVLFLLCLSYVLPALALKGDSWCGFHMCVNATADEHSVVYQLTAKLKPAGWMAIGFGKHMINTQMVIVWKNRSNATSISQRITEHYREPHVVRSPPRRAFVEDVTDFWAPPDWETLAFKIPRNKTVLPEGHTNERYIWAFSKTRPSGGDADETINMHFGAGYFELDLTKDLPGTEHLTTLPAAPTRPATPPKPTTLSHPTLEVAPANISVTTSASVSAHTQATDEAVVPDKFTPSNHGKLIVLHGLLLSVGFLLFLPIGALVARWCRTLVSHWFKVHWISNMLLGFPVITLGFLLGPLAVSSDGGGHFRGAHHIYGFILYGIFILQLFLGRRIESRPVTPDAPAHPPINILHMVLGLSILCSAVFQTYSGLQLSETALEQPVPSAVWGLWKAWVAILPIAYLAGLVLLPRQLKADRSGAPVIPGSNYIALPDRADDPQPRWTDNGSDHTLQGDEYSLSNSPRKPDHSVPLLQAEEA
ncbi:hypothetical protein EYR40_001190 [Pleurotus pulmonarius]|nr:hypothetical protein EYR40_001190 [Pleurotus pulmonarius]